MLAVCAATWGLSSTKPSAADGSLKTWLLIAGMLGQWLVAGGIAGFVGGRGGWLHGLLVAVVGCPVTAALWRGLLHGWKTVSLAHWLPVLGVFALFAVPLALVGGIVGGLMSGPGMEETPRRLTIRPG